MKVTTLCFCVRDDTVLLGMKKRKFGAGKWNGYGGGVKGEETPQTAAVRELKEESGLRAREDALNQVALVHFYFEEKKFFECHVFLVQEWEGEPQETEEMGNHQWYPVSALPLDEMWVADGKWIPLVLDGMQVEVLVRFNADGDEVQHFSYQERQFA